MYMSYALRKVVFVSKALPMYVLECLINVGSKKNI